MIARLFSNVNFTGSYQDLQQPGRYSKADGSLQISPRSFQVQSGVKISLYQNNVATHSIFIGNANDVGASWYDKIDYMIVESPAQTNPGPVYIPPPAPGSTSNTPPPGYSFVQQYAGQPPAGFDSYRRPLYPIVANVPLWNAPRRRRKQPSNNILGGDFLTTLLTVKLIGGI